MAAIVATATMAELDSLLCSSSFSSSAPTDASPSNSASASLSSTPPTTISPDSMSLASEPDLPKPDIITAANIQAATAAVAVAAARAAFSLSQGRQELEPEQHEPGQQSPPSADAIVVAEPASETSLPPSTGRPRRARASLPVYNIAKLAGTDVHGRRRSKGDVLQSRRRTISDGRLPKDGDASQNVAIDSTADAGEGAQAAIAAPDATRAASVLHKAKKAKISKKALAKASAAHLTRRATRLSGIPTETMTTKISALSKQGKKAVEKGLKGLTRELRRLQDTNEFAGIDTRPVRYTVWSKGKYTEVDPTQPATAPEPPRKKAKVDKKAANAEEELVEEQLQRELLQQQQQQQQDSGAVAAKRPRSKKWLEKGLYAGQEAPLDIFKGLTAQEKKKLATIPELMRPSKSNRTLPQPMYNGLRVLLTGRDFKLPFDVCNPLPPGQPKPAAYRTMTKNRFVGDAAAYWKKTPHFEDSASKCVCQLADGCGEDCQNRIMLYECDDTNCNLGKAYCTNRAFQDLQARTKQGGRYRVGVEVVKTGDRGYGVRSNRCFEPNQIIMEYTGEIITDEECERRMNEVYKDNECYYLMSFDQNMIIDATTGSIARFVNHSCSPNCRMIKWIVSGQPRMALFAGDRPIMTGEELTYDYNFDPFSAKNVQKCLCGSPNCRGVLGPKPKEVKPPKLPKEDGRKKKKKRKMVKGAGAKAAAVAKVSAQPAAKAPTKRKLKDVFDIDGGDEEDGRTAKKRKMKAATGVKKTLSSASLKAAKGAVKGAAKRAAKGVTKIKRGVASVSVAAKKKAEAASKVTKAKATVKKTARGGGVIRRTAAAAKAKAKPTKAATATSAPDITSEPTPAAAQTTPAVPQAKSKLIQTKIVFPSRSPSLTIVAAGVSATPPISTNATTTPTTSTPPNLLPAPTSEPAAAKTPQSSATPQSSTSASKALPKLTFSSGGRKVTPSRKAVEAGLAAGSPVSMKQVTKIKLVNGTGNGGSK